MRKSNLVHITTVLIASALLFTTQAMATDLVIGEPAYGGTGCPAGTASITLSPDQQALSILFDQYVVEAGFNVGKRVDRKSCNVAIPVTVPQGYSIAIFQMDYRGFNSLPYGASSQFNIEYFFAGSRGPRYSKRFVGNINQDFIITNNLIAESLVWTPCGAPVTLRANTSMMVQTNGRGEQALSTIDSMDLQSGVIYHIQWKRCGGGYGFNHL